MAAPPAHIADLLTRSHQALCAVEVIEDGVVVATIPVSDGQVTIDGGASVRRRCTLTVPAFDSPLVPSGDMVGQPGTYAGLGSVYGADTAATYGQLFYASRSYLGVAQGFELRVWRGVAAAPGSSSYGAMSGTYGTAGSLTYGELFGQVMVQLGVFGVGRARVRDSDEGPVVEVEGWDRSRRVARARWTQLYSVAAGTNYTEAIHDALQSRLAGVPADLMSTGRVTPLLVFGEERQNNPWKDLSTMARNLGAEILFDARGIARLRPEPDPAVDPVAWRFVEGENCTMLDLERYLDDERTYNGVIVTGEHPDNGAPVRAEVWDDDPASPTYRFGGYGEVPYFVTSAYITTQDQAREVARATLRRVRGVEEAVELTAVPNPYLDAGDVIEVVRARAKTAGRFIVESVTIPLTADGAMSVSARRQRDFVEEQPDEEVPDA